MCSVQFDIVSYSYINKAEPHLLLMCDSAKAEALTDIESLYRRLSMTVCSAESFRFSQSAGNFRFDFSLEPRSSPDGSNVV